MTFFVNLNGFRFGAGIKTDKTTSATLTFVVCVMISFGIKFFVKI
jgi:hypothetical protein